MGHAQSRDMLMVSSKVSHDDYTETSMSSVMQKQKVSFSPSETRVVRYDDGLSDEERAELWSIRRSSKAFKGEESNESDNFCLGGLEAFYKNSAFEQRAYYVAATIELHEEFFEVDGSGLYTKRRNMLMSIISKINEKETSMALNRAAEDRSAADQIYNGDFETRMQRLAEVTTAMKTSNGIGLLTREPMPKFQSAATA